MSLVTRFTDRVGTLLAIKVSSSQDADPGLHFFTKSEDSLQLGTFNHPANHVIPAHYHLKDEGRCVPNTNEVIIVVQGTMWVTLFSEVVTPPISQVARFIVTTGYVLLLVAGGHKFEMVTPVQALYVKQGPYLGKDDKRLIDEELVAYKEGE